MKFTSLDSIISEYENAYSSNRSTDLRDFVSDQDCERIDVLVELIRVDMELRWDTDQRNSIQEYLEWFPILVEDESGVEQILFEDYRLRVSSGEDLSPFDYQDQYSINVYHWPVLSDSSDSDLASNSGITVAEQGEIEDWEAAPEEAGTTHPDLAARITDGQLANMTTVESSLHARLRFFSAALVISLLYLSVLSWFNPTSKVGLFLGSTWLIWVNGICLILCTVLCATLWYFKRIELSYLRVIESVMFGLVLAELSSGLISDLFIDEELTRPMAEGEHALFHYASSWSLPFFALIVAYGTLIPSTWRRCTLIVSGIAIMPILICTIAVISYHEFSFSFFQSFFVQMVIWMVSGCLIAIYGVRRLEQTQARISKSGKLGKYQLIRRVGIGGMGQVYMAEHRLLRRKVAVKLMHPRWTKEPDVVTRFEREVQVLAGIRHQNIVQVYDFGYTTEGVFYYVMEFLDGMDLKKKVGESGALPTKQTVEVLVQISDALHMIHSGGIVHRDLKPANIFLEVTSDAISAKLLDFGLLKLDIPRDDDKQLTQVGEIIGTPAYMSPEQAAGRVVDHRTDIYSLGAIGCYLLTGADLFVRRTHVETLNDHIKSAPKIVVTNTDCPMLKMLHEILLRCLAKDPRCRFQEI